MGFWGGSVCNGGSGGMDGWKKGGGKEKGSLMVEERVVRTKYPHWFCED